MYNTTARGDNQHILKSLSSPLEKVESLLISFKLHVLVLLQGIGTVVQIKQLVRTKSIIAIRATSIECN